MIYMAIYCHALCSLDRRDQLNGREAFEQGGPVEWKGPVESGENHSISG